MRYIPIPEGFLREDTLKYFRITLSDQMEQMADLFGRMAKAKKSGIRIEMPEIKALTKLIAGEHTDAIKKELEKEMEDEEYIKLGIDLMLVVLTRALRYSKRCFVFRRTGSSESGGHSPGLRPA